MRLKSLISIFISLLLGAICTAQDKNNTLPPVSPEHPEMIRLQTAIYCQQENRNNSMTLMKLDIEKLCILPSNKIILSVTVHDNGKISNYETIEIKDIAYTLDREAMYKTYPCLCSILDSTNLGHTDFSVLKASSRKLNPVIYTFLLN